MAKTVNIKLSSSTGSSTGPTFDLFSDANSYASAFESGVSKTTLMGVGGYTSTVVPDAATIIRVKSTGTCTTYDDYTLASQTPTPTPTAVAQTPTPTPTAVAQTPTPTPTAAPITYTYDCDEVDGCYAVEGTGGTYSNLSACQDDCIISPPPCFIEGTSITMSDGTTKLIEELIVGDTLMSFNIEGLPLDSDTNEVLSTWNTNEIVGNLSQTTIVNIVAKPSDKTILINNLLRTTEYHRHLIKRSTGWSFIQSKDVLVGQFLLDNNNNEIEVTSVDIIEETVTVYKMDVESLDVFYAENILTHNRKNPDTYYCREYQGGPCTAQASPCQGSQIVCTEYEQPVSA
jgi:hypothetical protein